MAYTSHIQTPDLQGLKSIMLATTNAHKFYEQFGFKPIPNATRFMIYNPPLSEHK
jgi:N-acetylglutamate synthase-like GNAT family acetyltransferase